MGIDDLELADLATAAGVSPRTIRYYVTQKLLPSPGTRGPGTKWDRALLDRLLLIKELQRKNWPLAEIREHLRELDEEGVRQELGRPPELPLSDSALSYVRRVIPGVLEEQSQRYATPALRSEMRSTTWEVIRLAPGVELSIRRPVSREQNQLADRLLDAARTIFSEER